MKAYFFSEGSGMYALDCKTVEQAVKTMRKVYKEWDDPGAVLEYYGFDLEEIKPENVKAERIYLHRV